MTFRPSDDVLDELTNAQQPSQSLEQYNTTNQDDWQHMFSNPNDSDNIWVPGNTSIDSSVVDVPVEEIKAPDLSELLKNTWDNGEINENVDNQLDNGIQNVESQQLENSENVSLANSTWQESLNVSNAAENIITQVETEENKSVEVQTQTIQVQNDEAQNDETTLPQQSEEEEYITPGKLPDVERIAIVSWLEWSINSNLDFLVDNNRLGIVKNYKMLNRLFFRWWTFILSVLIWIASWIVLQVYAGDAESIQMIDDSSIENKNRWVDDTSDKLLSPLVESGIIDIMVPYWSASFDWESFQTKSNLISYKWIILPQLSSMDYNSEDFISLEDFDAQNVNRDDIKNLINSLIIKSSNYKKTSNLPNVSDTRWIWNVFQGKLLDGFSLWCINSNKPTDFVCDKFLDSFNEYGKYYDLVQYSSEILDLVKDLKNQNKDIEPICKMVNEYVLHAWNTSENLTFVMDYCNVEYSNFYKKMIKFIELENSLWQPELSDKVFDDPDLNAYKLLSAQQSVSRILDGTSLNESYIESYLTFVQALINKDKGNNRYLLPIYKDMLYVFNVDELYQKLMKKWKLSSEIKIQIDQINNWNILYGYSSLISQLTTPGIVQKMSDFTGMVTEKLTLEEVFSQYYAMTDRLKIRRAAPISENQIKVQTEMFTDKILSVTNGETLKITVVLNREGNLLYVDSIKVANQKKLSDILSIYAEWWNITFYAMLSYIEEQVWMWYDLNPEEEEPQPTICDELQANEDISIYSCDDSSILLYKWEVEYNFILSNWILDSYTISDENLDKMIKDRLDWIMFMKDNTPTIITAIIDFTVETQDDTLEKKLDVIDQFRIHFKLVPESVENIDGENDEFLVKFTIWEFDLQARYNVDTHLLTKVSYVDCDKVLEIRWLTISVTKDNESQLIEILNNPKMFLTQVNPAAYRKYQKMCDNQL